MEKKTVEDIKSTLADTLGIEPDDISNDDSLVEDLHMQISDLSGFFEKLKNKGYDISKIENDTTYTFSELCEQILE